MLTYQIENELSVAEFRAVLIASTLGERRPIDEPERLQKMLEHANLIVTARDEGKLIAVSRSLSDFAFCTYLSDLAVDVAYQHLGIGTELIRQTKLASPQATLILLSAPKAIGYYPKIGMSRHEYCFFVDRVEELVG
jgi:ribosomal protein S18 acetylase RimI-like enzyme